MYSLSIECDQEENKPEQALQIIGYVVAEFYTNKRSICIERAKTICGLKRYFIINKSYLMNFTRRNYNCAFYYLIMYKINKSNI
jgi:hypothetical protein